VTPKLGEDHVDDKKRMMDEHVSLIQRVCDKANSFFLYPHNLQYESLSNNALLVKQKCYAFENLWKKDKKTGLPVAKIVGLGSEKRVLPPCMRQLLRHVNACVRGENFVEAVRLVKEFVTNLATHQIPLEQLSLAAVYNDDTAERNMTLPLLFKKVKADTGQTFERGSRIDYIITGLVANKERGKPPINHAESLLSIHKYNKDIENGAIHHDEEDFKKKKKKKRKEAYVDYYYGLMHIHVENLIQFGANMTQLWNDCDDIIKKNKPHLFSSIHRSSPLVDISDKKLEL
jgi:hypothetical protein